MFAFQFFNACQYSLKLFLKGLIECPKLRVFFFECHAVSISDKSKSEQ